MVTGVRETAASARTGRRRARGPEANDPRADTVVTRRPGSAVRTGGQVTARAARSVSRVLTRGPGGVSPTEPTEAAGLRSGGATEAPTRDAGRGGRPDETRCPSPTAPTARGVGDRPERLAAAEGRPVPGGTRTGAARVVPKGRHVATGTSAGTAREAGAAWGVARPGRIGPNVPTVAGGAPNAPVPGIAMTPHGAPTSVHGVPESSNRRCRSR